MGACVDKGLWDYGEEEVFERLVGLCGLEFGGGDDADGGEEYAEVPEGVRKKVESGRGGGIYKTVEF